MCGLLSEFCVATEDLTEYFPFFSMDLADFTATPARPLDCGTVEI